MRRIDGMKIERSVGSEPLPAGGYVAKILNAEVKEYDWGEVLVISFDIAKGEHKDFFAKQYKSNTSEDKKWKGNFRINVPQENNQYFESQKRSFGNAIACIEESNNGYHWAWDESTLKGKMVGVIFRNFEWEMNGNSGWSTECGTFVSVEDIHSNNFRLMKDRPLKNKKQNAPVMEFASVAEDIDSELPF